MTSPFKLIQQAFQLIGENPKLFIKIVAVPGVFALLVAFFQPIEDSAIVSMTEWAIFIPLTIVMVVTNILMVIALTYAVADRNLGARQAYTMAKGKFWKYLGFSFLLGLITLIAFILLIIPAIIVGVWLAFGTFFLLLENLSITNALKASRDLVKGRWWAVAWRLLVLIIFTILVYGLFNLLLSMLDEVVPIEILNVVLAMFDLVYTPVATAFMFLLYFNLKTTRNTPTVTAPPAPNYEASA